MVEVVRMKRDESKIVIEVKLTVLLFIRVFISLSFYLNYLLLSLFISF